jgi:hypothetical protein
VGRENTILENSLNKTYFL